MRAAGVMQTNSVAIYRSDMAHGKSDGITLMSVQLAELFSFEVAIEMIIHTYIIQFLAPLSYLETSALYIVQTK